MKPTALPDAACLLIGMDLTGPLPLGEKFPVLVVYYSRHAEIEIMKSISTSALEPRLRRIFAQYEGKNKAYLHSFKVGDAVHVGTAQSYSPQSK